MHNPIATIEMEDGAIMAVELFYKIAPNTVANFAELANSGFYDGTVFHRIINGFMIQGGGPDDTGIGGPGYSIRGEFSSNGFDNQLLHQPGVISMARTNDPNSAGCQFFIVVGDASHLDGQYAAFGKLVDDISLSIALDIAKVATPRTEISRGKTGSVTNKAGKRITFHQGNLDAPIDPVVIKQIRVDTFGEKFETEKIMK